MHGTSRIEARYDAGAVPLKRTLINSDEPTPHFRAGLPPLRGWGCVLLTLGWVDWL
jgi:hypothetical protein